MSNHGSLTTGFSPLHFTTEGIESGLLNLIDIRIALHFFASLIVTTKSVNTYELSNFDSGTSQFHTQFFNAVDPMQVPVGLFLCINL